MLAEAPVLTDAGAVRSDDVYSVLLDSGEVLYELAIRFPGPSNHMPYVARLRWRTFLDPDPMK